MISAEYDHAHRRQTKHNKKLKMHGLSTSGYHMISALRGIWPMYVSLEVGMLVRNKSTRGWDFNLNRLEAQVLPEASRVCALHIRT